MSLEQAGIIADSKIFVFLEIQKEKEVEDPHV
jgi:hypothetical protein